MPARSLIHNLALREQVLVKKGRRKEAEREREVSSGTAKVDEINLERLEILTRDSTPETLGVNYYRCALRLRHGISFHRCIHRYQRREQRTLKHLRATSIRRASKFIATAISCRQWEKSTRADLGA